VLLNLVPLARLSERSGETNKIHFDITIPPLTGHMIDEGFVWIKDAVYPRYGIAGSISLSGSDYR
jgi:hypothetical protein